MVQLTLDLAPHVALTQMLHDAADSATSPLQMLTGLLRTAKLAELSSFGRIAEQRVEVIAKVEKLRGSPGTLESVYQDLISEAPWLVDAQWSPITANQSFTTLKKELQKLYKKETGKDLVLEVADPQKRADFVLSSQDGVLQLVEIKPPEHAFDDNDFDRLSNYVKVMRKFFATPSNKEILSAFSSFHITLVCDSIKLSKTPELAYEGLVNKGEVTRQTWATFLARTRKTHQDFLHEADRQRRDAARTP